MRPVEYFVDIVQTVPRYIAVFKHLSLEGQQAFPIHVAVPNASLASSRPDNCQQY